MSFQVRVMAALALLCLAAVPASEATHAQEIDFGQIDKFESFGTGTLHVGSPPKDQSLLEIAKWKRPPNNHCTWKRRADV